MIECRDLGRLHTEVTKHRIPGSLWYRVKRLLESPTAAIMTFWMRSTFSLQGVSLKAPSPLIVNTPSFSSHSMPSMVPLIQYFLVNPKVITKRLTMPLQRDRATAYNSGVFINAFSNIWLNGFSTKGTTGVFT